LEKLEIGEFFWNLGRCWWENCIRENCLWEIALGKTSKQQFYFILYTFADL